MNFATTKQRILQYIEYEKITTVSFLSKTGIKRGFLDSDKLNGAVSDLFIAKIIAVFPEMSLKWLLTGEGEMIKSPQPQQPLEDMPTYLKSENKELKAENKELNKQIGWLTGTNEMLQKQIEELKKTAALKEEDAKCAHVAISHLESIAIK